MKIQPQTIHSKAPTRIDLAGGTVDIWPLYLFIDRSMTLNMGIDLFAEATLEIRPSDASGGGMIHLRSEDQNQESRYSWSELETAQAHPALDLQLRLLRHFAPHARVLKENGAGCFDLTLKTLARSPAGAGLGGSSTLNVAITGALATWAWERPFDPNQDGERLIEVSRDVETTVIRVPAGLQDYYGAMFGGLQSIRWGAGVHTREWLSPDILAGLEDRLLLFYSGQSRNSGINNWQLFKGFIDGDAEVRRKFQAISNAAHELRNALLRSDWIAAGAAIRSEWEARRMLASGISTSEIDEAFTRARALAPESAAKVCGAGGGGCFFIYLPEPSDKVKESIQKQFAPLGVRALPFSAAERGLHVTCS